MFGLKEQNFSYFTDYLRSMNVQSKDTALTSVMYLALLGRRGCEFFEKNGTAIFLCTHPHRKDTHIILPEIGYGDNSFMLEFIEYAMRFNKKIMLSRFFDEDLKNIIKAIDPESNNFIASIKPFADETLDWNYPAHILSTEHVSKMKGGDFKKLRTKCNVLKSEQRVETVRLEHDKQIHVLRYLLKRWEANMILNRKDNMDIASYYEVLFEHLFASPEYFDGVIFYVNGVPSGLTIWDHPLNDTATLLTNMADYEYSGLAGFQIAHSCKIMNQEGIKYCDLGGSETEGLDTFKQRYFNPVQSLEFSSAHIHYKTLQSKAIIRHDQRSSYSLGGSNFSGISSLSDEVRPST